MSASAPYFLRRIEGGIIMSIRYRGAKVPLMEIVFVDEDFTSKEASQMLIMGGMKKSKRKEKGTLDKVAASLILERYLSMH